MSAASALCALAGLNSSGLAKSPVPASAERPWAPPHLGDYERALAQRTGQEKTPPASVDPHRIYSLAELIDLAERNHPDTRVAWERARQAAAGVGLGESLYYPYLVAPAGIGYERAFIPFPTLKVDSSRIAQQVAAALPALAANPAAATKALAAQTPDPTVVSIDGGGSLTTDAIASRAALSLKWLLIDFGERRAGVAAAKERLMMANVGFNATHQKIVFEVTRKYYLLSNARQKVLLAKVAFHAAQTVEQAARARLGSGLATKPELLQAQQQSAQAEFDLQAAFGEESNAHTDLVEAMGISPAVPLRVTDLDTLPLPPAPERSADALIDLALSQRAELIAKLANLRAREAEVRAAQADFYPKVAVDAHVGRLKLDVSIADSPYFGDTRTVYGAGVAVEMPLFDGFARREKLRLARAEAQAAESELAGARDGVVREVWRAFTDFKIALRKQEAARKLLLAAESSYDAVFESYEHGLSTYVEVENARRNATAARVSGSETRAAIFTAAASLAWSVGDLAKPQPRPAGARRP